MESNMPVCVMVKFGRDTVDGIYLVNDNAFDLGECQVEWTVKYGSEKTLMFKNSLNREKFINSCM